MDTNGEKNKNKSECAENIKTFENIDLQDGLEYVVCWLLLTHHSKFTINCAQRQNKLTYNILFSVKLFLLYVYIPFNVKQFIDQTIST